VAGPERGRKNGGGRSHKGMRTARNEKTVAPTRKSKDRGRQLVARNEGKNYFGRIVITALAQKEGRETQTGGNEKNKR